MASNETRVSPKCPQAQAAGRFRRLIMLFLLLLALLLIPSGNLRADSRPLDIYWIDTEGGAATLLVSPSGESFLIDTDGWSAIAMPSASTPQLNSPA
jgi:hypothetical protein